MKLFLDFDDSLFNTRIFINDYMKRVFPGVPRELYKETRQQLYDRQQKEGKSTKYDVLTHVDILRDNGFLLSPETVEKRLEAFFAEGLERYVFPDVLSFLDSFKKEKCYIVTFGDENFQKTKVERSGLAGRVCSVVIAAKEKGMSLKEWAEEHDCSIESGDYFIDDHPEYLLDVKRYFPQITTILLKRPEGRYNDPRNSACDFEVSSLRDVERIIKKGEEG